MTTERPGDASAATSPGISRSGPLVTTTNRAADGSPSAAWSWNDSQNPAHDEHPVDRKARRVRPPDPAGATARAPPSGVTPAMVGAEVESRSGGSCGPIVKGTGTGRPDAAVCSWALSPAAD